MRFPDGRILIFAKAPVPGYAKTRLIPVLGAQGAADLQARLIRRTVGLAVASGLAPVELWVSGESGLDFFDACSKAVDGRIHLQNGPDLGARMGHAFEQTLRAAESAVLIGTDCPPMDSAYLERAFVALAEGADAVLGPAEDGGYVLIGLRRCDPLIFDGIAWGTAEVLRQTRERIRKLGWLSEELPVLWDVDQPADVERLCRIFPELISTRS